MLCWCLGVWGVTGVAGSASTLLGKGEPGEGVQYSFGGILRDGVFERLEWRWSDSWFVLLWLENIDCLNRR